MFSPIKVFKISFMIYLLIIALIFIGPINYPSLSAQTYIYSLLGYFLIWRGIKSNSNSKYIFISNKKIPKTGESIILFLSVCSILLNFIKYYSEGILFSDLDSIISNRLEKSFSGNKKGTSIYGIIGNLLNGFVFLYYGYSKWKEINYNKNKNRLPTILLILSAIVSILGGGRFGIIIHLLFYYIINKMLKINISKKTIFLFSLISLVLITITFILKLQIHDSNLSYAFNVATGFEIKDSYLYLFGDNLSGLISEIIYYFTHSLYEFNFFLNNYSGTPQFGAYQFYPYVLLINKFGITNISSIEEILLLLPKAGVYSTAFSAMIIDFGYLFGLFTFYIIGSLFSNFFYNYYKRKAFLGLFIYCFMFIYVLFVPIISMIGTSIFPAIILCVLVYLSLSIITE